MAANSFKTITSQNVSNVSELIFGIQPTNFSKRNSDKNFTKIQLILIYVPLSLSVVTLLLLLLFFFNRLFWPASFFGNLCLSSQFTTFFAQVLKLF